MKQPY